MVLSARLSRARSKTLAVETQRAREKGQHVNVRQIDIAVAYTFSLSSFPFCFSLKPFTALKGIELDTRLAIYLDLPLLLLSSIPILFGCGARVAAEHTKRICGIQHCHYCDGRVKVRCKLKREEEKNSRLFADAP